MNVPDEAFLIASRCKSGSLTPLAVADVVLSRMKAAEGEIGAFLEIGENQVRSRAEALTRSGVPHGGSGLLFGVPVAVKDNICAAGFACTCGSLILKGYHPIHNATVVDRILAEGGIIVGKTNLDEFAMGSSTEHSAYKPARNPWNPTCTPGGSSGGSAAALASGAVPLALGSDTGGSIRQPASLCGVVGFKPTYGTVSRFGLVAFASSLDQIGPMSRTVQDAALLFQVIAGPDARDSTSLPGYCPQVLENLEEGIEEHTVGFPREYMSEGIDPEIRARMEEAAAILERSGAHVKEISLPHTRYAIPAYYLTAVSEASSNLARYDGMRYGARQSRTQLQATYSVTRSRGLGQEVKRRILLGSFSLSEGYYDAFYLKALKVRRLIQQDFQKAFEDVDLIAGPASPVCAFPLGEKTDDPLDMYLCDFLTAPASLAGLPGISVPCGLHSQELPIGLQFLGPLLSDSLVLRAARAFEKARGPVPSAPLVEQVRSLEQDGDAR
ncbi:MAG: Asp-tRNA(Asn)/Glu-tRNA(Gln) amidotransferase subunit GatA [Planctomycetota bacterium]|jgi:aspartyl-tRNA(Asn)/glutamyl-tRNA(Gln) amidotransferase subunit A